MNPKKRKRATWTALALLLVAAIAVLALPSCGVVERRDPTGETFPRVSGESLSGERFTFPDDFLGAPTLIVVGYKQNSQFDIDRWLLGANQAGLTVRMVEMPTLKGLGARLAKGFIDRGMRSGIPEEDWSAVICVYGDAGKIVEFTGNENPMPGRVILLDAEGTVAFFHDRGYSVGSLGRLRAALEVLEGKD